MAKNRIFSTNTEYKSEHYSRTGRIESGFDKLQKLKKLGKLQERVIRGYNKASNLGVLEKSRFYGEDLNRLNTQNFKDAKTSFIEQEIKRLEKLFVDKKRTNATWLSKHQGMSAHDLIKNYFDTHPEMSHTDFSDIYDVFDEIEAEEMNSL